MHSQKIFIMTIVCIIAFTATPLVAAENIASYSAVPGNLLLAQAHEQHVVNKSKHDKKVADGHAGHKEHGQQDKMGAK